MATASSVLANSRAFKAARHAPPRTRSGINSGLDVLECLAAMEQVMSLTEIATTLGMAKSSIHKLLLALEGRGWVQRQADQRYSIGVKAWEVGCRATFVEIGRVAEPYMAELVRKVSEGAALALLDGGSVVCIQIAESPQVVRVHRSVGERNPAYCVSNGLALLATRPDEEIVALYPRKLHKLTAHTIVDRDELVRELQRIRQRGYAVCRGSWKEGVGGVAAAIRAADGRAVASVSIALPLDRLTDTRLKRIATALLVTAAGIERQLGGPAATTPAAWLKRAGAVHGSLARRTVSRRAADANGHARRA